MGRSLCLLESQLFQKDRHPVYTPNTHIRNHTQVLEHRFKDEKTTNFKEFLNTYYVSRTMLGSIKCVPSKQFCLTKTFLIYWHHCGRTSFDWRVACLLLYSLQPYLCPSVAHSSSKVIFSLHSPTRTSWSWGKPMFTAAPFPAAKTWKQRMFTKRGMDKKDVPKKMHLNVPWSLDHSSLPTQGSSGFLTCHPRRQHSVEKTLRLWLQTLFQIQVPPLH